MCAWQYVIYALKYMAMCYGLCTQEQCVCVCIPQLHPFTLQMEELIQGLSVAAQLLCDGGRLVGMHQVAIRTA